MLQGNKRTGERILLIPVAAGVEDGCPGSYISIEPFTART